MSSENSKGGILTNSMWLTGVKFMTMFITIIITKILSEELSLLEYGTYSQGNLIKTTAVSLSILGLSDGVNFFFNRSSDHETQKKYMNTVFGIQLMVGLVCSIVIFGGQNLLTSYFQNKELIPIYIWLMFSPMLENFIHMYQVLVVSIGKAKVLAARNMIMSLMRLFTAILATKIFHDITIIFMVLFLTDALQVLYFAFLWKKHEFWINPIKINFKLVREVFAYCLPLAVYILTSALTRDMDKMIVSRYATTEEFAIFTNSAKVLPFDILTVSMATVMIPVVTRFVVNEKHLEAQDLYRNYLQFAYTTTWIIAGGAVVCSYDLMHLLYDEKYVAGLSIFIVYVLVDMARFANVGIILRAKGRSMTLMVCSFVSLFANFVLNIVFINWFGIIGPAISTLIVTAGMNLFLLYSGAKIIHSNVIALLNVKNMLILVAELLLCAVPTLAVRQLICKYIPSLPPEIRFFVTFAVFGIPLLLINYKKMLKLMRNINRCKG